MQQVRVVLEPHRGFRELSIALDENLVMAVDQDIGNAGLLEQCFERSQPQDFVQHFLDDLSLLGRGHGHALFVEQALHHAADFGAHPVFGDGRNVVRVQHTDQLAMDLRFQLEVAVGAARGHRWRPAARG